MNWAIANDQLQDFKNYGYLVSMVTHRTFNPADEGPNPLVPTSGSLADVVIAFG